MQFKKGISVVWILIFIGVFTLGLAWENRDWQFVLESSGQQEQIIQHQLTNQAWEVNGTLTTKGGTDYSASSGQNSLNMEFQTIGTVDFNKKTYVGELRIMNVYGIEGISLGQVAFNNGSWDMDITNESLDGIALKEMMNEYFQTQKNLTYDKITGIPWGERQIKWTRFDTGKRTILAIEWNMQLSKQEQIKMILQPNGKIIAITYRITQRNGEEVDFKVVFVKPLV